MNIWSESSGSAIVHLVDSPDVALTQLLHLTHDSQIFRVVRHDCLEAFAFGKSGRWIMHHRVEIVVIVFAWERSLNSPHKIIPFLGIYVVPLDGHELVSIALILHVREPQNMKQLMNHFLSFDAVGFEENVLSSTDSAQLRRTSSQSRSEENVINFTCLKFIANASSLLYFIHRTLDDPFLIWCWKQKTNQCSRQLWNLRIYKICWSRMRKE